MKKIRLMIALFLFTIITSACTSSFNEENFYQMLENTPEEPETIEDIVQFPKGMLSEMTYEEDRDEIMDVLKTYLPPINEETEEAFLDEWWRVYHSLFAEEYPDPSDIYVEEEFEPFSHPGIEDERYIMKEQMNVLVILDVSGSMGALIDGRPMIDIAKDSIQSFTSELPEDANVGLRVYGHKGKTKERSCESSELVYNIQAYDQEEFASELEGFEPLGHTPLAQSLLEAREDFEDFPGENNTNIIYVVSDGLETCGDDPVAAAASLSDSNIQPIINVIGFDVDDESQLQLQEISEAGLGTYAQAGNEEELDEAFQKIEETIRLWEEWRTKTEKEAKAHRDEQISLVNEFTEKWRRANNKERMNIFYPVNELRSSGYITEEAHSYFANKRSTRFQDYSQLNEDLTNELTAKMNDNYLGLMTEIVNSFQENIGGND